jgi:thiol-disulfide isomerase/thioredoxin
MNIRGVIMVMLMGLAGNLFSQVEFIEVVTQADMEAAMKKADDGILMVFVDVYATWCGPCKMMDSEVYTDVKVADYMNANFVNVRLDGETDFGRKYAAEQQLEGYPSMFVFSDEGDRVSKIVGFRPADELLTELNGVVTNYTEVKRYKAEYENGTISMEHLADYIVKMREVGNEEEAELLAGDYIKKQMGETLSDNDIKVVAYYTDLEDPWWPQFTSEADRVKEVLGQDYLLLLEKIYNNTLMMAIEQQSIGLISRMANELSPLVAAEQENIRDLRSLPFLQYYYYTDQLDELFTYVDQRFANDRKDDHQWLFGAASQVIDMDQQYQTPEILEKGEEWLLICLKMEDRYDYYFYYGMVKFFRKDAEGAQEAFESANALAVNDEQRRMVAQVLQYVKK